MLDAIAHDGGREFSLTPEFTENRTQRPECSMSKVVAHFSNIVWLTLP